MVVLEFYFTAGRYHATPWDAEANEGRVEWPPSPWRIARALVSSYHQRHPDLPRAVVAALVEKLGGSPAEYVLPPAVHAHTRHFMPRVDKNSTTKVFDAFLRVPRDQPLVVAWERVDLTVEERDALTLLIRDLPYLGRAESWVEGRVVDSIDASIEYNCGPEARVDGPVLEELLALVAPGELVASTDDARERLTRRLLAEERAKAEAKGKPIPDALTRSKQRKVEVLLPTDPLDALEIETTHLRKAGLSRPVGTRVLRYRRPEVRTVSSARTSTPQSTVHVMRWAVVSNVVPHLTQQLHHAERLHQRIVKAVDGDNPKLTGIEAGQPVVGHRHVHILAEPDADGRIASFALWLDGDEGLSVDDRAHLGASFRLWGGTSSSEPLGLVLTNTEPADSPYFGRSRRWRSLTPFIPTRHPRTSGSRGNPRYDRSYTIRYDGEEVHLQQGSPAHDLIRLLRLNHPDHRVVSLRATNGVSLGGRHVEWRQFRTRRLRGQGKRGPGLGTGFEIEFEEPVEGPLILGYAAHFGLGAFTPIPD